ncbi:Uncharacterised protein [Candidatus Gugararchaeum adminiculabundum]|nr:Uncharacterised protein [Candidatus Gugararchaeum adminiculabundum]
MKLSSVNFSKLFMLLLVLGSLTFAESEMMKALNDYYKYSKDENIDAYYGVQDLSDLSPNAQQLRKEATQILWERFDTVSYLLVNATEYSKDDFGLIEYHIAARIRGPDESGNQKEFAYEDDFVAIMHNVDGQWKVNQIQQLGVFYANMENFYLDSQTDAMDEINEKAIEKIDAQPPSDEMPVPLVTDECSVDSDCGTGMACVAGTCQSQPAPSPSPFGSCPISLALLLILGSALTISKI